MTDERDEDIGLDPQDSRVWAELHFCLCERDPASGEVREDLIKAMALNQRFGLLLEGCLEDAAAAFDEILLILLPNEARNLEQLMHDFKSELEGPMAEADSSGEVKPGGAWLH